MKTKTNNKQLTPILKTLAGSDKQIKLIKKYGWAKFLHDQKARRIASCEHDVFGTKADLVAYEMDIHGNENCALILSNGHDRVKIIALPEFTEDLAEALTVAMFDLTDNFNFELIGSPKHQHFFERPSGHIDFAGRRKDRLIYMTVSDDV